jgi:NAD(P)-dependent dehydrogenase (short-subunit alcohol dehydrogenase family)
MAERGWRLAVVDLNSTAAERVASAVDGHHYAVAMRNLDAMDQFADDIERDIGPVDLSIVTAAVFQERTSPETVVMEQWRTLMQVNLQGTFNANRAFAGRMAKRGRGYRGQSRVRVNSVSPGSTLTARHVARDPSRYAKNIDSQMALGRRVQSNEVAEGIEFLASSRASGITGIDMVIDGGWLAASMWGLYGGVPGAKSGESTE